MVRILTDWFLGKRATHSSSSRHGHYDLGLSLDRQDKWQEAEAEYREMTLPQYYKSVAEFAAPLTDPDDPVHRAGLRLEQLETRIVSCPFAADFARHGDAAAFARAYVPTLRSWTESTFHAALSAARPPAERRAIIDRYYDRYEALVRERPTNRANCAVDARPFSRSAKRSLSSM